MTKDFIDDLIEVVEIKKTVKKSSKKVAPSKVKTFEIAGVQVEKKYTPSDETRRKASERHKGKVLTEETRRKISEARKGIVFSEETRRKIGDASRGRIVSEETRRKMSEAGKRRKAVVFVSEETRRKMSETHKAISQNLPIMTPNGKFISRKALKERLVADGYKEANARIREWFKLYPNDYYYIKDKK